MIMLVSVQQWLLLNSPDEAAEPEPPFYTPVVFEVDLQSYLQSVLDVAVWSEVVPQGKPLPALTYTLVSSSTEEDLDGPCGVCLWSVQFDAYAPNMLQAATLIERLRSKLDGFTGLMGATWVQTCTRDNDGHGSDPLAGGSGQQTKRRMAEYTIAFEESIPVFG